MFYFLLAFVLGVAAASLERYFSKRERSSRTDLKLTEDALYMAEEDLFLAVACNHSLSEVLAQISTYIPAVPQTMEETLEYITDLADRTFLAYERRQVNWPEPKESVDGNEHIHQTSCHQVFVNYYTGEFWFADEAEQLNGNGPFRSLVDAQIARKNYFKVLNRPKER